MSILSKSWAFQKEMFLIGKLNSCNPVMMQVAISHFIVFTNIEVFELVPLSFIRNQIIQRA